MGKSHPFKGENPQDKKTSNMLHKKHSRDTSSHIPNVSLPVKGSDLLFTKQSLEQGSGMNISSSLISRSLLKSAT